MLKLLVIIYILTKLFNLNFIGKVIDVILPFFIAFVLAYIIYPLLKKLNKFLPKCLSIIIIILILFIIIFLFFYLIIPLLIKEIGNLLNILIFYINLLQNKYDINITYLLSKLDKILDYKYIFNSVSISVSYITKFILCFISFIYLLIDMNRIETMIKNISNKKIYNYLYILDKDVRGYITSLIKISIISFFEYSLAFKLIGHSDCILMGLVAGITNLIPYIGGIFVLIVGILTSPSLIIKTSILYFIMGLIDNYIINPYIYGKYNQVHPLISLISMSLLGYIFGFIGIIFSIPITIIIITTYRYFKNDIYILLKQIFNKM